jgi:hypothetical protein
MKALKKLVPLPMSAAVVNSHRQPEVEQTIVLPSQKRGFE